MSIKERVAKTLDLPKDIMLDFPKMTALGNKELSIENYKGIIEYSEETIRLNTTTHMLKITGKNMEIKNITQDEIELAGLFTKIELI